MNNTLLKFAITGYFLISFNHLVFAANHQVQNVLENKINSIIGFNDTIFAGTPKGLFVSFNNGEQWNLSEFCGKNVSALEFDGKNIYAAVDYFIYYSIDRGKIWGKIETSQDLQSCMYILSLLKHRDNLFVGLDDCNPFILSENSSNMKVITYNNENVTGFQFLSKDSLLFIASDDLFRSLDNGNTLQKITPAQLADSIVTFKCLTISEIAIFASCNKGIFRSTDNGNTWIDCTPAEFSAAYDRYDTPLATSGNVLLAGISPSGIIRSKDNGTTWLKSEIGFFGTVTFITSIGTTVFAGTGSNGIFRSDDSGKTWQCVNTGISILTTAVKKYSMSESFTINSNHHSTIVNVTLSQPQRIDAEILNLSGRKIASLVHARFTSGSHHLVWNNNSANSGCFIVKLRIGETVFTRSILRVQ
jgi:photosystem II stability/assembly factor-like uncharacterized protein